MAGKSSTYRILLIGTFFLFFLALFMVALRGWEGSTSERLDFSWSGSVGLVEVNGFIGNSESTVKLIEEYASRSSIKALLVKIDSPGGVTVSADEIYRALMRARSEHFKPVVAYLGSVAASGGYYIACAADTIVAHPSSTTGSIGVIIEYPVAAELFDKIGLRWETITTGPYKSMGSPFEEPTERHREWFREVINDSYEQFFDVVLNSRRLDEEELRRYADGRVFTGRQAVEWGLADHTGDFRDARALVGRMAGLGDEPDLVKPRTIRRVTFWDLLLGRAGIDEIKEEMGIGPLNGPRVLYLMR